MTITEFTTLPCAHTKLLTNLDTLKQDILDSLGKPPYAYSDRNNYTKQLPQYLTDLLVSDVPCEVRSCFVSVIPPKSTIPYHNDGQPSFSVNLPLKSCDNLSYIHPTKEVADKFVKTIEGANADGSIFRYELAETFETTEVTTSSGNGPTLLNVKQFHSAKNEHATLPAIFLCIRFVSNQEKAAFEILQNV